MCGKRWRGRIQGSVYAKHPQNLTAVLKDGVPNTACALPRHWSVHAACCASRLDPALLTRAQRGREGARGHSNPELR